MSASPPAIAKTPTATLKLLFFWLGLVACDTSAQVLLKLGAEQVHLGVAWPWKILAGYGLILGSFLFWMQILKRMRLSIALSLTAILYITVVAASHFILFEPIDIYLMIGTGLIAIGVALQSLAQRAPGL